MDLNLPPFLTAGALGAVLGACFTGLPKFFWEKFVPDSIAWRRQLKQEREKAMTEIRGPAVRVFLELSNRIISIVSMDNFDYLRKLSLDGYYLHSTAYLFARCFAWVELLRRTMSSLDYAELYVSLGKR